MSFLRLAVNCAVFDARQHVLVSRRGDLDVWNLPSGRVDSGEILTDAAAREVCEETGIRVQVERAVGLYYLNSWQRLNVLYAAIPIGGVLRQRTDETRANDFFPPDNLPTRMYNAFLVQHALSPDRPAPQIVTTPTAELRRVKWRLRWRWLMNLLRDRPEPRYVRFDVHAVGLIWDEAHRRILTLPGERLSMLPRVHCDGRRAPWEQLGDYVRSACGLVASWHWVGLWQDTSRDTMEFVFAATISPADADGSAEWLSKQNNLLMGQDADYVERTGPGYRTDVVWLIHHNPEPVDTVIRTNPIG